MFFTLEVYIKSEMFSTKDYWSLADAMHTESYISSKPYFLTLVLSRGTQPSSGVWIYCKHK